MPLLIVCLLLLLTVGTYADVVVESPDSRNRLVLELDARGAVFFRAERDGAAVLNKGSLGFRFLGQPALIENLELVRTQQRSLDENWQMLWGEASEVRNHFQETSVWLRERTAPHRSWRIDLRAYNDGLAFRSTVPRQPGFDEFELVSEETRFALAGDYTSWWIPDNWDTYEMLYTHSPASQIGKVNNEGNVHTHAADRSDGLHGCNTPVTMQAGNDLYLAIHEAELTDYAGMTLVHDSDPLTLKANLVPWPDGVKVRGRAPLRTPWRTLQLGDKATDLIDSHLIVNLNPPNALARTDYIRPMKLVGIWWSMHLGITTWGMEGGRHGATTEEVKRYLDFAHQNGFDGVLVEGWNTGWESWYKDDNFDFTTPYSDFDLPGLAAYAQKLGVQLVGHLETGGQIESFEKRLEPALEQYQKLGVSSVKTGYAGKIRPAGYYHHGQWMVRHYRKVLEAAARHGITVNAHEPIKPTGIRRTYPNMMTREGVRGMEWNAWSRGNPPEHTVNLAFTRMLAGPLDYTPGIFDLKLEHKADQHRLWNELDGLETKGRMHSTLARQLALFVVLYSPIQMASDQIENYENHPALEFIREVPVTWDQTRALDGSIGDFVVIARRSGDRWFVGAISDEEPRRLRLDLDFLEAGRTYQARVFSDSASAHYQSAPLDFEVRDLEVKGGDHMVVNLAAGGGQAVILSPR